jgi:Ser/Thr protein kinase RdoA (MazF antagonist)
MIRHRDGVQSPEPRCLLHPPGEWGLETPFLSVGHARHAGKVLAKLHDASADYGGPARHPAPLVSSFQIFTDKDPWQQFERYAEERPALHAYLSKRDWIAEARETIPAAPR